MSRRSHKRSRNGCTGCKQRHIRCDETRPSCVNCRTVNRVCSFADFPQSPQPTARRYVTEESSTCDSSQNIPVQAEHQYIVNMEHLYLYSHFCTEFSRDFYPTKAAAENSLRMFHQYLTSASYVVHQALALSALHLSIIHSDQQAYYRDYASGLQTQALSMFNNLDPMVKNSNSPPCFVFCALVAIHVLCNTLRHRSGDLNTFLDDLTRFFRIHQGVRIVASTSYSSLRQSELRTHLESAEKSASPTNTGTECDILQRMIQEADIGQKSLDVYHSTLATLQTAFDVDRCAQSLPESRQMLFAWTILVPPEYIELLAQRRPEALVILAYYGVLLHRHRGLWLIGDGGVFLVRSIRESLGTWWEQWLEWPCREIEPLVTDMEGSQVSSGT